MSEAREVDVVVVGGGPSGLAAALWLARYRRSVVVIDSGEYRSARVERSHGYLGRDPQRPTELLSTGRDELLAYPTASILRTSSTSIRRRPDGRFDVETEQHPLLAHRVVLATGVQDAFPEVDGFDEHYGASVFHCPACDGYEARDRDVVALGWDARLVGFATTLLNWARSLTVVTNGHTFEGDQACRRALADHGIELIERNARAFEGERGDLRCLVLDDGRRLDASWVFFSVAHVPRTGLAVALGCDLDDEGYVKVGREGQTTTAGVYACGDVTPGLQLVAVAAASGVVAGVAAAESFFGSEGAPTSPEPAPDPTPRG